MAIALLIFSTCFLNAQIVNVPDANFKNALLANSNVNVNNDGEIQTTEALGIYYLDLSYKSISDLTGIEAFSDLVHLNIDVNQLSAIDLSQNTQLKYLFCSYNSFSDLDFSQNVLLNELACDNNPLTNINLTLNLELTDLRIYNAQLSEIDLTQNIDLRQLNCNNNNLSGIDLSQNNLLRDFSCINNDITGLDLSFNPGLIYLSIALNPLNSIDLSNNINLESFGCSTTNINSLDLSNNLYLYDLDIRNLPITTIDLSQNIELRIFDSGGSSLQSIDFSNNPYLSVMALDNSVDLSCVNLKNNSNPNFGVNQIIYTTHSGGGVYFSSFFSALNCPNLDYIIVDNISTAVNTFTRISPNTSFSNDIADCQTLSVHDNENADTVVLFPNPASDVLNIELNNDVIIENVSLYDIHGKELFTISNPTRQFNLTNYASGVYFIKIATNKGVVNKRIIKN